ncbi:DNA polymerase epsilon catalytic subunit [Binucleata daphniae]
MDDKRYFDFGYVHHKTNNKKIGYLLNFNINSSVNGIFFDLFFVNSNEKYYITKRFFPSLLIKGKNCEQISEIVKKNYNAKIYKTEIVNKIDPKKPNHLCLPSDKYIEVFFYNEADYKKISYELKKITKITKHKNTTQIEKVNDNVHKIVRNAKNVGFELQVIDANSEKHLDLEDLITSVEEYDLPIDISFLSNEKLRCGKFYETYFCNEKYEINEIDIVTTPNLTIFAFDIETTKQPLKFPCAETDQIMMISFMINNAGFLINNNEFICEDVQNFQYKIVKKNEEETINFEVYNYANEEQVLRNLNKIIEKHKPDIITTYNGDFFDIPFLEKRLEVHNIENLLAKILHLDCYKWVKRDSYLPMGSQGLKAVTKAKLGYFPDDVDPELMMWYGKNDPKKLCVYSVSDAVATYNLYVKYVNPFIFSLCTLIPLSPYDVLSKGSGTLCESLLIAEALQKKILIPPKRIPDEVYFEGKFCDDTTYIGGHVECLKSGIYRSDFEYLFRIKQSRMQEIINLIPEILKPYKNEIDYEKIKQNILQDIANLCGTYLDTTNEHHIVKHNENVEAKNSTIDVTTLPFIYHLDVAAMYPNIILTNRLQPISVIGKETCIRCDYYTKENNCQKNMKWQMRVEYFMPNKSEIETIKKMLQTKQEYSNATTETKEKMFKEHLASYSKDIYKKTRETKVCDMENIVCQRENPFYVDVVQKFRDKRYELKNIQKEIVIQLKTCETEDKQELQKKIVVYESLQVAHKSIVCNTGSKIIKLAKDLLDDIGIPLELDTDGIWCLVPQTFPNTYYFASGKKIFFVCELLNLLVKNNFTNYQYHEQHEDENNEQNKYKIVPKNEIVFEIDGPYRAMILPASTEEGKLIKKKYLVINQEGKISELKGFEFKRRGELKIVKKFQEDIFAQFLEGDTLKECYAVLKETCMYYLDIIKSEGMYLSNNDIFELFSESKNMSKEFDEYAGRKTTSTLTANKMSEFLGKNILQEKGLKCQYIVSKYPANAPTTERTIPIAIFQTEESVKKKYMKKWSKNEECDIKKIIDWNYYKERLVNVMLKIIILPGILQGLGNLISEIEPPKWARTNKNKSLFDFDILKVDKNRLALENNTIKHAICNINTKADVCNAMLLQDSYKRYINSKKKEWKDFVVLLSKTCILEIQDNYKTALCRKRIQTTQTNTEYKIQFELKKYIKLEDFIDKFVENEKRKQITEKIKQKNDNEYEFVCAKDFAIENKIDRIFNNFYVKNITKQTHFDSMIDTQTNDFDVTNSLNIFCILTLEFSGHKYFICKTKNESFVVTDSKNTSENIETGTTFVNASIYNYIKQIKETNTIYFIPRNSADLIAFFIKTNKTYVALENNQQAGLNSFKAIIKEYITAVQRYYNKSLCLIETSTKFNIPLINLSKMSAYDFIDFLYYKELKKQNLQNISKQTQIYDFLDNFYIEKGYFQNFCVTLEIKNSMINAILNDDLLQTFDNDNINNNSVCERIASLRRIVRNLKSKYFAENYYIENVIDCFDAWTKTRLVDCEIKNCLIYLQKIYLSNVMNDLKKYGAKIIQYNNEFVMIETMKTTKKSCEEYSKFVFENVKSREIKILNVFRKIAIVDVFNIYYLLDNTKQNEITKDEIFTNNEKGIPSDFLLLFFSNKMTNRFFYDLISQKYKNKEVIINMLNLFETYQNIDKLRSSCYDVMKINLFIMTEAITYKLNVCCKNCNFDGSLFVNKDDISVCLKCLENHASEVLDDLFCKMIYQEYNRKEYVCNECSITKVYIVTTKCKCGGTYTKKINIDKINTLRKHIQNKDKKI